MELKREKSALYSFTVLTLQEHHPKTFIKHSFSTQILNEFETSFLVPKFLNKYRFIDLPSKKSRKKLKKKVEKEYIR